MHELAPQLYQLCERASRDMRQLYYQHLRSPLVAKQKADGSPVTLADSLADDMLRAGLQRLTPGLPVISDEASLPAFSERRGWQSYWLVDPLDGTREFIAGTGHFCINIALLEDNKPVLGAIYLPLSGEMYWGGGDHRPEVIGPDGRRQLRPRIARLDSALKLLVSSRGRKNPRFTALKARLGSHCPWLMEEVRGSGWKYCRLVEGGGHCYARFGPTSEWDTAAGQALLEAAGGEVLDAFGEPLRYNTREDLANPDFFALAPADFSWRELLQLQRAMP